MRYYPHMPGNSCSADQVSLNTSLQDAHMNKEVVHAARRGSVEEVCAIFPLSDILDHYFSISTSSVNSSVASVYSAGGKRTHTGIPVRSKRVALLKVDVEGDEYEVLRSLSCTHWSLVDRVIAESNPAHVDNILELLVSVGFGASSMLCEHDCTGNTLIYAFR